MLPLKWPASNMWLNLWYDSFTFHKEERSSDKIHEDEKAFSYHAWDASCPAAEVAYLAVGALCCPQPPLGEQPRGPDPAWGWDVGNGATGPSSLPVVRYKTHSTQSDKRNIILALILQKQTSKNGYQRWPALISHWGHSSSESSFNITTKEKLLRIYTLHSPPDTWSWYFQAAWGSTI